MFDIKMFAMLPRRRDISPQVFHDHWRHPHGTFGRTISTVRRYVQSHQIHTDLLDEAQSAYEGIVEVWFDNVSDAQALPDHPVYRRYLVPDEPLFIDMDGLRYVFTRENVLMSGKDPEAVTREGDLEWDPDWCPSTIKIIQFAHDEDPGSTPDEVAELAPRLGALRHVRCAPASEIHPEGACVGRIDELWWPTVTAFDTAARADRHAWQRLVGRANTSTVLVRAERFL